MECKILKVEYSSQDYFKIPRGLDLENEDQVEGWGVKWNKLYIILVGGKQIVIESQGLWQDFDWKYPTNDNGEICDAVEYGFDEDDFEFFDCENGDDK